MDIENIKTILNVEKVLDLHRPSCIMLATMHAEAERSPNALSFKISRIWLRCCPQKGKANVYADALSCLKTLAETIIDEDNGIPSFRSEEENFTLSHMSDEIVENAVCFSDEEINELDECSLNDYHAAKWITTLPDIQSSDPTFQPISEEELITTHLSDPSVPKLVTFINRGRAGSLPRWRRSLDRKVRNPCTGCHAGYTRGQSFTYPLLCTTDRLSWITRATSDDFKINVLATISCVSSRSHL